MKHRVKRNKLHKALLKFGDELTEKIVFKQLKLAVQNSKRERYLNE